LADLVLDEEEQENADFDVTRLDAEDIMYMAMALEDIAQDHAKQEQTGKKVKISYPFSFQLHCTLLDQLGPKDITSFRQLKSRGILLNACKTTWKTSPYLQLHSDQK
jgi:hypothetical protein